MNFNKYLQKHHNIYRLSKYQKTMLKWHKLQKNRNCSTSVSIIYNKENLKQFIN